MRKNSTMKRVVFFLLAFSMISVQSTEAEAAKKRRSPLTNAPAIRKRLELRSQRFEIGVGSGVSIGQDFYNALLVMPRMSYHFTDWIALGVFGGFNVTPEWKSTFNADLQTALPAPDASNAQKSTDAKSPTIAQATATMNKIGYLAGAQIEFLPLAGKLALFSEAFMYFDLYIFGGAGVVNLISKGSLPGECNDSNISEGDRLYYSCNAKAEVGIKPAINAGLGAHAFLNNYLALGLEIRDFIYRNNSAGRDVNGDRVVDTHDLEWTNNWIFSVNLQLFMPFTARTSR